jgi:hypothetical protein
LFLVVLALVSQMAFATVPLSDGQQAAAEIDALSVLCTATAPAPGQPPAHHHHGLDCALCPFCAAMATPSAMLAPGTIELPAPPSQGSVRLAWQPPARAPPAYPRRTALPRGPPVLT